MAQLPLPVVSVEYYLGFESGSAEKHEFIDGYIVAMAGGSYAHSSTWVYPDFAVACEGPRFIDTKPETLVNPTFLVEVLSPTTANYDRDLKAPRYLACPSVREFLLISQTPVEVEQWVRGDNNEWRMNRITEPDAVLSLASLGVEVPVREFCRRVEGS